MYIYVLYVNVALFHLATAQSLSAQSILKP